MSLHSMKLTSCSMTRIENDPGRIGGRRGVGVLSRVRFAEHVERPEVEHDDRAVVARGREAVARRLDDRGAMRAMNSRDLADQPPIVFVDHHQPILPADEQSMVRHVRNRRGTA